MIRWWCSVCFRSTIFQAGVVGLVVARLQHFSQVHGHLCPGGGAPPLGASSMLDCCDVLWLKVLRWDNPGREGSWEKHSFKDIQWQVRGSTRCAVPLGGVLSLSAAAVPPHCDTVVEVWFLEGFIRLEAKVDGPRPAGLSWLVLK